MFVSFTGTVEVSRRCSEKKSDKDSYLQGFKLTDHFTLVRQHHFILIFDGRQQRSVCFKVFNQIFKNFSVSLKKSHINRV